MKTTINSSHFFPFEASPFRKPEPLYRSYHSKGYNAISLLSEGTIVHAMDNQRLEKEISEKSSYTTLQKIKEGVVSGIGSFCKGWALASWIYPVASRIFDSTNRSQNLESAMTFNEVVFIAPLTEEIFFRGILGNGIHYSQKLANFLAPSILSSTKTFQWLVSPSCAILGSDLPFAISHLGNGGGYLSTAGAVSQMSRILLLPTSSILHQTTGSLTAPIVAHMTNNFLSQAAELLYDKLF